MMMSLFVFSTLPFFHFLGPKAMHARGAVQFPAKGSGGCITFAPFNFFGNGWSFLKHEDSAKLFLFVFV
jgi:hypothetical protein